MPSTEPESFRPGFGRWLSGAIGAVCGVTALLSLTTEGIAAIVTVWPWLALLGGSCWLVYWQPEVRVDRACVTVVNVWHRVEVPWSLLIGLETKWALTLVTADRRYRAWAAPAPGRTVMRHQHANTHRLKDAAIGGEIRPGDLPHTDSGTAALMVRSHWKAAIESGELDSPAPGLEVRRTLHWRPIAIGVALLAIAIAGSY